MRRKIVIRTEIKYMKNMRNKDIQMLLMLLKGVAYSNVINFLLGLTEVTNSVVKRS